MSEKFVYVTYIQTTQDKLWAALTEGEISRRYWGNRTNASDWKAGSRWEHRDFDDASKLDIAGHVLEVSKPDRLVISWARPAEVDSGERTSRVTFEIKQLGEVARLTVTHEELDEAMGKSVAKGWPYVLASLKTFLETGHGIPGMDRERNTSMPE